MIKLVFEAHGTTMDNEAHLSSGHADVELSEVGIKNAQDLGERHKDKHYDLIFCSDLQRSYKTAEIAFGKKFPILQDPRLRECDYGEYTQHPSEEVEAQKIDRILEPFPGGESYTQTNERMLRFLEDLKQNHDGKTVMIIGHRATQYGIETYVNGASLERLVSTPFKWQPGWEYLIK